MDPSFLAIPLVLGLSAVFAAIGMGGASVYVPIFIWLGIPLESAIVSGLFINVVTTAISSYTFHTHNMLGKKEYNAAFWIFVGIIVGAPVGAWLAHLLEPRIIIGLFAIVLFIAAIRMQLGAGKRVMTKVANAGKGGKAKAAARKKDGRNWSQIAAGFFEEIGLKTLINSLAISAAERIGMVAKAAGIPAAAEEAAATAASRGAMGGGSGMVSGTLGIGGGIFLVPFLIETGTEPKKAAVLSHICTLFGSIIGIAAHFFFNGAGAVKFEFMLWAGAAATVGSVVGSKMMAEGKVQGEQIRGAFVLILLLLAIKLALDFFGLGGAPLAIYD